MNKKLTKREKQAQRASIPSAKNQSRAVSAERKIRRWLGFAVAVVGMLVYANTIGYEYVLDDWGLIPENKITRKGFDGVGEIFKTSYRAGMDAADNSIYRPLSKATFAVEWAIAPNQPGLGHATNVILYGLLCWVMFGVLSILFKGNKLVPLIAVLLFAVHPLHTEVVANIKSRDEILSLLFLLLSCRLSIRYIEEKRSLHLVTLSAMFFLAMLAKESSITWIAVLPLTLYFFRQSSWRESWPVVLAATLPSLLFLMIRHNILGTVQSAIPMLDNPISALPDFLTQRTTAIAILGTYVFKLFVPYPLVSDGSFNSIPPFPVGDWHFLLSMAAFLGLAIFTVLRFRSKDPLVFTILYFFLTISIVSNVVIMIGTCYAERLLFAPSMGWCIAMAVLVHRLLVKEESSDPAESLSAYLRPYARPLLIVALLSVGYAALAINRNPDWKDNYTLYTSDIRKVPQSAHMRFYLANHISSEEYIAEAKDSLTARQYRLEAIAQLDTAIQIYPDYSEAFQRRAFILFSMKDYEAAEPDFKKALSLNASDAVANNNYGTLLFDRNRFDEARQHFETAVRYNPRYAHAFNNLASVYGVLGESERRAATEDPANRDRHLLNAKMNFETAISYFQRSIKEDPDYSMPYYLMGMTYRNLGDESTAQTYFAKAEEVKKIKRYNAGN